MVHLSQRVHPRGFSLSEQRRVYILRKVHKQSWETIAPQIKNLQGEVPYWQVCRDAYDKMFKKSMKSAYQNCGRNAKITPSVRGWIVQRLNVLRKVTVCTSNVLQRALARKKKIIVEASTVRKHLKIAGYKWLRRLRKLRYTDAQREERKVFADQILKMTRAELMRDMHFCMDGVVLTIPPQGQVARPHYIRSPDLFVWR